MNRFIIRMFLFAILLISSTNLLAQLSSDTLVMKKRTIYDMKGRWYNDATVLNMMKYYPEASLYMKKAITHLNTGRVLVYGSTLLLIPIFVSTDNSEKLMYAGIMFTLDVIGLTIATGYKKNAQKAIKLYNFQLQENKLNSSWNINVGFTPDGFGMVVRF